jgi:type 1 fimbria pilin
MRHVPITLVALLLFATIVSAQTVTPFNPRQPESLALTMNVSGNADIIVARLMTFDRNNDGLVAKDELPDRMRSLVVDDADGALDHGEILALVAVPRPVTAIGGGFPRPGGYTFGDQFELSSRSHVLGALDDLRLPASTREHALAVVNPFIDLFEAQATTALLKDLEVLLTENQLAKVRAAADRQLATRPATISLPDGTTVRQFVANSDIAASINQFPLPAWQRALALEAVRHFKDRLRSGEAERTALLEHLKGILSDEERDNFRAALARRPLVKAGGIAATATFTVSERVVVTP